MKHTKGGISRWRPIYQFTHCEFLQITFSHIHLTRAPRFENDTIQMIFFYRLKTTHKSIVTILFGCAFCRSICIDGKMILSSSSATLGASRSHHTTLVEIVCRLAKSNARHIWPESDDVTMYSTHAFIHNWYRNRFLAMVRHATINNKYTHTIETLWSTAVA